MNRNRNLKARITAKGAAIIMSGLLLTGGAMTTYGALNAQAQTVTESASGGSYSETTGGTNAILVDGRSVTLSDITVTKMGSTSGENADFYGTNAAVLAKGGATLTLNGGTVTTNGAYANGIFSYGSGTTVNVSGMTINTSSNNSGGIMTTGGAAMNAENLTITTQGGSSAAIRSDRGGGTVNVTGGTYTTNGVGSPAIYSTADITVSDATLVSNVSEAVVVEGGNSVTLNDCDVTASNTKKNGQSTTYQNVMLYQSMSGDAAEGGSSFTMSGGSMTANNGAMFYVTNTSATINLHGVSLQTASGQLIHLAAGAWGNSGSNGGKATVNASAQTLSGAITVDDASALNLVLKNGSTYNGAINADGQAGSVYVEVPDGCTWTLTGDSYVGSLTCGASSIDLNGHTLYVNGTAYEAGTSKTGETADVSASTGEMNGQNGQMNGAPGQPGQNGQMNGAPGQPGQNGQMNGAPGQPGQNGQMNGAPGQPGQNGQMNGAPGQPGQNGQMNRASGQMGQNGQAAQMNGTANGECPFSISEILKVAVALHNVYNGGSAEEYKSATFETCQKIALENGWIKTAYDDPDAHVSEEEALAILQAAVPAEALTQSAGSKPDGNMNGAANGQNQPRGISGQGGSQQGR